MEDDETVIVGSPLSKTLLPGAERYSCSLCTGDAWIGPASREILRQGKAKVICITCYLFDPKVEEPLEVRVSSRSEVIAAFGSEEKADQVIRQSTKLLGDIKKLKPVLEPWKRS